MVWQLVVLPGAQIVTFTYMMLTAAMPALLSAAGPWSTMAVATLWPVTPLFPELPLPELPLEEVVTVLPPLPPQPASNSDTQIRLANRFRMNASPSGANRHA